MILQRNTPMQEMTFEPLRVRAHLQAPVVGDAYLPLDGLIFYQIHRHDLGAEVMTLPGEKVDTGNRSRTPMPFEKRRPASDSGLSRHAWYWASSFAQWPAHTAEGKDHWNKRFDDRYADLVDFGKRRGKVITGRGDYKAYHMPVFYRHALYVEWYCMADKSELERWLPFCTHLGKKYSQGWGAVLGWEVMAWPEDWSERGPGGKIMRALPVTEGGRRYGIRPSYWNRRHQFPCLLPT